MLHTRLKHSIWLTLLAALPLLASCASSESHPEQKWQGYPKYDIDSQVIYRIDDHRYLLMSNYPDCDYVRHFHYPMDVPRVYYRDDKLGVSQQLSPAVAYYRGKLIIDASKGNTIAFPAAPIGGCTTTDRGCPDPGITYSTDAGRTWQQMPLDGRSWGGRSNSPEQFKSYTVTVTDNAIFVSKGFTQDTERKPIGPDISYSSGPGAISAEKIVGGLPRAKGRTPSGMDRLTCDPKIKPRGVTYHKVSPTEYFELP